MRQEDDSPERDDIGPECSQAEGVDEQQLDSSTRAEKKRDVHTPESATTSRQAPDPEANVAGVGPTPSRQGELAWSSMEREDMEAPDVLAGGATLVGATTTRGVNVAYRTKNTLELAGRIGRKPVQILIDSGSTGNYVAARVCTVCKLKTEKDAHGEELRMAEGTTVKIEDRVQVNIKCGKYRALVQAKVFPGLQKPMILGIPWLAKENPQIDWTQGAILVQ